MRIQHIFAESGMYDARYTSSSNCHPRAKRRDPEKLRPGWMLSCRFANDRL